MRLATPEAMGRAFGELILRIPAKNLPKSGGLPATLLVLIDEDSLMGRVEKSARAGGHWWAERHTRDRRVALLRPYSLRFHLGTDGHIQLIFYHGDYAAQHRDMVRSLADPAGEETLDWSPGYCCSVARVRVTARSRAE